MKKYLLTDFIDGKIVGSMEPVIYKTYFFEISIIKKEKENFEPTHHHTASHEIVIIIEGSLEINNEIFKRGEICYIEEREKASFYALEDSIVGSIKIPSVLHDKHKDF
jgi:hypothetical protein